jgi:3-oxoacyl-[acyl-carrier protein] reductase
MKQLLKGKVALVTGSGRGIGRAIAEHLAKLGCSVALHGMREEGPAEYGEGSTLSEVASAIASAHDVRTMRVLADLTKASQALRMVEQVETQLGPVDIFVHNAGGDIAAAGGKPDPNDCVSISAEDVQAVVERNFLATIFSCQAVARGMMERRGGRIITVSSTGAFLGRPKAAIYASAKAGVIHFTRCLATQLRPYNVTVNSIAPGETRTARFLATRLVPEERLATEGTLERIALVEEVSRVVEFFAGPLGDFVSGQALRVDGGAQCWPG